MKFILLLLMLGLSGCKTRLPVGIQVTNGRCTGYVTYHYFNLGSLDLVDVRCPTFTARSLRVPDDGWRISQ